MTNSNSDNLSLRQLLDAPLRRFEPAPEAGLLFPSTCAAAPGGNILVLDDIGHAVFLLGASGELIRRTGKKGRAPGEFLYPAGAAFAPDGRIFITDCWNHRIQIFSPELEYISSIGSPGNGAGQLLEPWGITFFNGHVIVAERENRRISVFDEDGSFAAALRNPRGSGGPLSCVTSLIASSGFLALLMDSNTVLILDEDLNCENIIKLNDKAGAAAALYPAGPDIFIVASYSGEIKYYTFGGALLRTETFDFERKAEPSETAAGVTVPIIISNLAGKTYAMAAAPAAKQPLFKLLENSGAPRPAEPDLARSAFFSEILAGETPAVAAWPADLADGSSGEFQTSLLKAAARSASGESSASRYAVSILMRNPAIGSFHAIARSAAADPKTAQYLSNVSSVELVETIEISPPGFERKIPCAAAMIEEDRFVVSFSPTGFVEATLEGVRIISASEPDNAAFMTPAKNGNIAACSWTKEFLLLGPGGGVLKKLGAASSFDLAVGRWGAPPKTIDGRIFIKPDFTTGTLDTFDLSEKTPDTPVRRFHLPGGAAAIDAAIDQKSGNIIILTSEKTIIVADADYNILASRPAPRFDPYAVTYIDIAPDGDILATCYIDDKFAAFPSLIAKINISSCETIFTMDSYSTGSGKFRETFGLRHISQPIPTGADSFWILERVGQKLRKFRIGGG